MENKTSYTIRTLLEELKIKFPKFENNQVFETLKSIYPTEEVSKESKNITLKGKTFTKPLAANRKDKNNLLKEGSALSKFFRNTTRGDFLKVIETNGVIAKCINLSLKEDIKKKYYDDDDSLVKISIEEIANGTIKPFKRKVDKFFNLEE